MNELTFNNAFEISLLKWPKTINSDKVIFGMQFKLS